MLEHDVKFAERIGLHHVVHTGVATFYLDMPPLNVQQRLDLKALFQKASITAHNGKESEAAALLLQKLLAGRIRRWRCATAGASRPAVRARPATAQRECQLLLKIHEQKDDLTAKILLWKKNGEGIANRWAAWQRLLDLRGFATGLPEADARTKSIGAITAGCILLVDLDPIPELTLSRYLRSSTGRSIVILQ